jgi:hypothetical protein
MNQPAASITNGPWGTAGSGEAATPRSAPDPAPNPATDWANNSAFAPSSGHDAEARWVRVNHAGDEVMVFRAIICCAALIVGLLATLSATAQSAGAPQPLNLMSFMHGSAKAGSTGTASAKTASSSKRRHITTRTAARPHHGITAISAASSEPPVAPVAAATAYASQSAEDVQVVSGDDVNAIDLAMNSSAPETDGAAARIDSETRDRFKSADATPFLANEASQTAQQFNRIRPPVLATNLPAPTRSRASPG